MGLRSGFEVATGEALKLRVFWFDVVAFGVVQQGVFGAADDAEVCEIGVVGLADAPSIGKNAPPSSGEALLQM